MFSSVVRQGLKNNNRSILSIQRVFESRTHISGQLSEKSYEAIKDSTLNRSEFIYKHLPLQNDVNFASKSPSLEQQRVVEPSYHMIDADVKDKILEITARYGGKTCYERVLAAIEGESLTKIKNDIVYARCSGGDGLLDGERFRGRDNLLEGGKPPAEIDPIASAGGKLPPGGVKPPPGGGGGAPPGGKTQPAAGKTPPVGAKTKKPPPGKTPPAGGQPKKAPPGKTPPGGKKPAPPASGPPKQAQADKTPPAGGPPNQPPADGKQEPAGTTPPGEGKPPGNKPPAQGGQGTSGGDSGTPAGGGGKGGGSGSDKHDQDLVKPPIKVPGIGGRYAHALYSAAVKTNTVDRVEQDLIKLEDVFKKDTKFVDFLREPGIPMPLKAEALLAIKKFDISDVTMNFANLVLENKRMDKMLAIIHGYFDLMIARKSIVKCEVITAAPLTSEQKDKLNKILEQFLAGKKAVTTETVNPAIVGGIVLTVGDKHIDLSMQRLLNRYEFLVSLPI